MSFNTMNTRTRAKIMVTRGGALSDVAMRCNIPLNTLKSWVYRYKWRAVNAPVRATTVQVVAPPPPQWMRSLHHDWAHLVKADGTAMCSARVPLGGAWMPAEETRRCKRCMGHEVL